MFRKYRSGGLAHSLLEGLEGKHVQEVRYHSYSAYDAEKRKEKVPPRSKSLQVEGLFVFHDGLATEEHDQIERCGHDWNNRIVTDHSVVIGNIEGLLEFEIKRLQCWNRLCMMIRAQKDMEYGKHSFTSCCNEGQWGKEGNSILKTYLEDLKKLLAFYCMIFCGLDDLAGVNPGGGHVCR